MNQKILSTIIVAVLSAASASSYAITKLEYKAEQDVIAANYKSAKTSCNVLSGNAKDICVVEAKGQEKIAKADLEVRFDNKEKNQYALRMAKADSFYAVAKEKCDDKAGNDKAVCVKEAKAVHIKAKSDAKLTTTVKNAVTDAVDDRVTADYKVAVEKCDVLAGEPKATCIASAKTKFNKS
jgi:hypothetical protein